MGIKVRAITEDEYRKILEIIYTGFDFNGVFIKPNERIAMALMCEAALGIRIGDVVQLRLESFVYRGSCCNLDIVEQKTGKKRNFPVPIEVYCKLQEYANGRGIGRHQKLFDITVRSVQRHLKKACQYLGIEDVSTHSFRKFYATNIYELSGYNLELVRRLLQHSSASVTQRYLNIDEQAIADVISDHCSSII